MNYFRNFIALAILATTLFAGQALESAKIRIKDKEWGCLLYTSPSPRDKRQSRMPSSA